MNFDFDDDELAYLDEEIDDGLTKDRAKVPPKTIYNNNKNHKYSSSSNSNGNSNRSGNMYYFNKKRNSNDRTSSYNNRSKKPVVSETTATTIKASNLFYNKTPSSILKQKKTSVEQQRHINSHSSNSISLAKVSPQRQNNAHMRSTNVKISDGGGSKEILRSLLNTSKRKNVTHNTSPTSSSSSRNSNSNNNYYHHAKPKRRKAIPGPVGIFKASLNKNATKALRSKEMVVSRIAASQDSIFDVAEPGKIIDQYSDFRQGPWLKFCYDHMVRPPMAPASYIPPKTTRRDPPKYMDFVTLKTSKASLKYKIPFTAGIIESFTENFESGKVVLKDPSGTMKGSLAGDAVNEYAMKLTPGTILVLQDIAIFTPTSNTFYFNITLKNIHRVIPAGTKIPTQMVEISTIVPASQDSNNSFSNNSIMDSDDTDDNKLLLNLSAESSNVDNNNINNKKQKKNSRVVIRNKNYSNQYSGVGAEPNSILNENKNIQQQHAMQSSTLITNAKTHSNLDKSTFKTPIMIGTSNKVNKNIDNDKKIEPVKVNNLMETSNNSSKKTMPLISKENLDELCAGVDFNFDDAFADDNFL
jgi:hypothetical protein